MILIDEWWTGGLPSRQCVPLFQANRSSCLVVACLCFREADDQISWRFIYMYLGRYRNLSYAGKTPLLIEQGRCGRIGEETS